MEYIVLFIGVGLLLVTPLIIEILEDLGIIRPKEILTEEELRKRWEELCASNKEEL